MPAPRKSTPNQHWRRWARWLVLVLLLLGVPTPAQASERVAAPEAVRIAVVLPELAAPPRLAERRRALRSSASRLENRELNEGRALGMGILGGIAGYAAGGLSSVLTLGFGLIGTPVWIVVGAAYGVHLHSEARLGWECLGAVVGLATAIPIAWFSISMASRSFGVMSTVGWTLGLVSLAVAPGVGAWFAGVTDTDAVRRRDAAIWAAVPVAGDRPGLTVAVRF